MKEVLNHSSPVPGRPSPCVVAPVVASSDIPRRRACLRPSTAFACASILLGVISQSAFSQHRGSSAGISSSNDLPDAPLPHSDQQSFVEVKPLGEGSARISGVVLDTTEAAVPGAQVSLTSANGAHLRSTVSGPDGGFTFGSLPAGSYLVLVERSGFETYKSSVIEITTDQAYDMPRISLSVASANTEISVQPTEVIAAAQIRQEEKQRVFGVIPNFYISYVKDAAPMTTRQKFSLAAHDAFDPVGFVGAGVAAGIEQANNSFAGYGQGAAGYGKRYAANFGNGLFNDYFSHAIYPTIFHQDPRYFYQGTGSNMSRLKHAASFAFVLRGDDGKATPNYSFLLGDLTAAGLSNLYYPHADRGGSLIFANAAIGIAGRAGGTILREFLLKRITTNVPSDSKP